MKNKLSILLFIAIVTGVWLMEACNKNDLLPTTPIEFNIPQGFPAIGNTFQDNPLTEEGFTLGRKLFYDGRLSRDGVVSCASCHQQAAGFQTLDHNLSHGVDDQHTNRNGQTLANVAWFNEFNWDGAATSLQQQPLIHFATPNEMDEKIDNIIAKLKSDKDYLNKFSAAFGSKEINETRILKALAQFSGSLVSANSKYDQVKNGAQQFTDGEQRGYLIFQQKCAACHKEPLFTDQTYRNIGLAQDAYLKDAGRMKVTNNKSDSLKFKVPTLRNIYVTQPYLHDGRISSLGAVIDHYRFNVIDGPTTDPLLKNKLLISDFEKLDLLQFLRTLTDTAFLNNKRFSQP